MKEKGVNAYSSSSSSSQIEKQDWKWHSSHPLSFRDEQFGLALATVSSHFSIMNPCSCSSLLNCFFIQKKFCSVKFCWKESNSLVTSHDIIFVKNFIADRHSENWDVYSELVTVPNWIWQMSTNLIPPDQIQNISWSSQLFAMSVVLISFSLLFIKFNIVRKSLFFSVFRNLNRNFTSFLKKVKIFRWLNVK